MELNENLVSDAESVGVKQIQTADKRTICKSIKSALMLNLFGNLFLIGGALLVLIALLYNSPEHSEIILFVGIPAAAIGLILKIILYAFGKVKLSYSSSDDEAILHAARIKAWGESMNCKRVWQVISVTHTDDIKRNAGSSVILTRRKVSATDKKPYYLDTDCDVLRIKLNNGTLCFLPDMLLWIHGFDVTPISYPDIKVAFSMECFTEKARVPRDAKVIGETWRFVNKDGSRDRRFNNNYLMPTCLYGKLLITSKSGLNVYLQLSDRTKIDALNDFAKVTKELNKNEHAKYSSDHLPGNSWQLNDNKAEVNYT
ncbi:MAG: hypothetical protein J1E60_07980 [Christensenellaceae bacterium]|nr:hypothetical protein [Christensenellaceae bacterium]